MALLQFPEALVKGLEGVVPIEEREILPIWDGLGRAVGEPVLAKRPSPLYTNAAMDGYVGKEGGSCRVVGEILAGDREQRVLKEGETYYIATGAKVPTNGKFVVPVEQVEVEGEWVELPPMAPGANIRPAGEEFQIGEVLLQPGEELGPPEVLALTGQGITWVKTFRPLQIGIYGTGNELVEPFQIAGPDQLYNSNSYGVYALLKKYHFNPHLFPTLPDQLELLVEELDRGLEELDLIVTIGGASRGRADYLRRALSILGVEILVDGVNLKPGKPLLIGKKGRKIVVGLPGNLLSSYLNALLFLLPIARKMGGYRTYYPTLCRRVVEEGFEVNPKKWHFVLGEGRGEGFLPYNRYRYGSGMVTPLLRSGEVALCPPGRRVIPPGTPIWTVGLDPTFTDSPELLLKELR
jgi:molybdopterin molybdotransferase